MKSLFHLVLVIVIASVLHDLQQFTTRSFGSEKHSLARNHGNIDDGNPVGVLMTGVSAAPKKPQRSKLIFQITIGAKNSKKKRGRKGKGKKSVRAKRRKTLNNRRRSKSNHRSHRNHYHALRKQYIKKLKRALKHRNHYHKPRPNNGLSRRTFGRKDMTWKKRRYDNRRTSRRQQPSRRNRPFMRNSRRGKQNRRQSQRSRKTPIRKNNQHRRPATSRRNQRRRPKKVPRRNSSRRIGNHQRRGRKAKKTPRRSRKTGKSKAVFEVWAYNNRRDKKSRRAKPDHNVYN